MQMRSTHANQAQSLRFTLYPLPPSFLPPTFHPPQGALAATSRPASYRATSGQSEPTALMTSPATNPTARLVRPLLPFSHPPPPSTPPPEIKKIVVVVVVVVVVIVVVSHANVTITTSRVTERVTCLVSTNVNIPIRQGPFLLLSTPPIIIDYFPAL